MLKVLVLNRQIQVEGGADKVFINTLDFLSTKNDVKVEALTLRKGWLWPLRKNNPLRYFFDLDIALRTVLKCVIFRPKAAIVHLWVGSLTPSSLVALKLFRVTVIHVVHDYRLLCPANALYTARLGVCQKCPTFSNKNILKERCSKDSLVFSSVAYLEAQLRKYVFVESRLIDHFVFVSEFSRNLHSKFNENFVNNSSVVYNGSPVLSHERCEKKYDFCFFGRLSSEKGIVKILDAFRVVDFSLLIIGDGPLKDEVETASLEHHNITYIGRLASPELESKVSMARFSLVSSVWFENNPMSIIESFHLGVPVIGSAIGGITELIGKKRGFLFEPSDINDFVAKLNIANGIDRIRYQEMVNEVLNYAREILALERHNNDLLRIIEEKL